MTKNYLFEFQDNTVNTYTTTLPGFIKATTGENRLQVQIATTDSADIGAYRLRSYITVYDSLGVCTNEINLITALNVFVFEMTPQSLADQY